jgi:hypothetical protein
MDWTDKLDKEKFSAAIIRLNQGWALIDSMRLVASAGIPHARKLVRKQHKTYVASLADTGQLQDMVVGDTTSLDLPKMVDLIYESLTVKALREAARSVDAASLVFAHAILDDLLTFYLQVTAELKAEFWERHLAQKKVELGSLSQHSVEEVTRMVVRKELLAIGRESLIKRADLLHRICEAPKSFDGSVYDPDNLARIDKLRHEIVHGDHFGKETGLQFALRYKRAIGESYSLIGYVTRESAVLPTMEVGFAVPLSFK